MQTNSTYIPYINQEKDEIMKDEINGNECCAHFTDVKRRSTRKTFFFQNCADKAQLL